MRTTPVLHLIVGPNGAGKTTFHERILQPGTHLPFINADRIAEQRWPEDPLRHAYDAAEIAAERRQAAIDAGRSFATETVCSHPSKLKLLQTAQAAGYRTDLHVILIPEALAVRRVQVRVEVGGHDVPEEKIRARFRRLWQLVRRAIELSGETEVLDNSRADKPFRRVARYEKGELLGQTDWPAWTPADLRTDQE